jgi:hypothetical protein
MPAYRFANLGRKSAPDVQFRSEKSAPELQFLTEFFSLKKNFSRRFT